jgi:hypothetical protein
MACERELTEIFAPAPVALILIITACGAVADIIFSLRLQVPVPYFRKVGRIHRDPQAGRLVKFTGFVWWSWNFSINVGFMQLSGFSHQFSLQSPFLLVQWRLDVPFGRYLCSRHSFSSQILPCQCWHDWLVVDHYHHPLGVQALLIFRKSMLILRNHRVSHWAWIRDPVLRYLIVLVPLQ